MLTIKKTPLNGRYTPEQLCSLLPEYKEILTGNLLFADLETTGLSKEKSWIYLIGIIIRNAEHYEAVQAFISDQKEEGELISWFFEKCRDAGCLIHFYGNRFDLPFLRYRSSLYAECAEQISTLERLPSLDLWEILKPAANLLSLPDKKQTTFESYLLSHPLIKTEASEQLLQKRIWPDGKVCISAMLSFLKTRETRYLDCVLGHNQEDLCGMLSLLVFLPLFQLKEGSFLIQSVCDSEEKLEISVRPEIPFYMAVEAEYADISVLTDETSILLSFHKEKDQVRLHYPNHKDYVYLPSEDIIVPKSLGRFLGKGIRTPATPENCFSRISSQQLCTDHDQALQFSRQNMKWLFSRIQKKKGCEK